MQERFSIILWVETWLFDCGSLYMWMQDLILGGKWARREDLTELSRHCGKFIMHKPWDCFFISRSYYSAAQHSFVWSIHMEGILFIETYAVRLSYFSCVKHSTLSVIFVFICCYCIALSLRCEIQEIVSNGVMSWPCCMTFMHSMFYICA